MSFVAIVNELTRGFGQNCLLFVLTLALSLPLGLLIALGARSGVKPLQWFIKLFVWVIRGTPLMLQVIIVFYVPGLLFGTPFGSRMTAVAIAFIINYAAYFSEIYRGGMDSIPRGQYEAGQVLGLTKAQTFKNVILLQVVKRIVPPMGNEIITLVKDTSLARIVAVGEVIMAAERFTAKGLIWPLFFTGIYFLVFVGVLTVVFGKIEKKLDYFRG